MIASTDRPLYAQAMGQPNLEAKIIDIATRQQQEQSAEGSPAAPELPRAGCLPISRMVKQLGVQWNCPGCNRQIMNWDPRLRAMIEARQDVEVDCGHCKNKHILGQQIILTPGDAKRVTVPTLQIGRKPRG